MPLGNRVRSMRTPRMMSCTRLSSTAAINLLSNYPAFKHSGFAIPPNIAQRVMSFGGEGTDTCGAGEHWVMKPNSGSKEAGGIFMGLSKYPIFGHSGSGPSPNITQRLMCFGGTAKRTCGAGELWVMKPNSGSEEVHGFSPGLGNSSRSFHGIGRDHCEAPDEGVMKFRPASVSLYGVSPPGFGHCVRGFSWKTEQHEARDGRVMRPEAGSGDVEEEPDKGVMKCKPASVSLYGVSPPGFGHCVRGFSRKTELHEARDGRVMRPEAGSGDVEEEEPLKVVEYLNSLRNFEKEGVPKGAGTESDSGFDLQRMTRLLQRLGDPLSKYPVVHVAGTKGKGSTVSFLSSILRTAGFRVGSYTSPHIQSLRERIICGTTGQPISARAFNQLFDDVQERINDALIAEVGALTHFEVLTALAFMHFARENVDVAVIEAGLGGARDATNVIQAPGLLAAVIVGIGEEHLDALGGSLESIARAKAGIIKHGRPVIMGRQPESLAENVIRQVAASKMAAVLPPPGFNAVYNMKGTCADSFNPHQLCDILINQPCSDDHGVGANKVEEWIIKDLKIPSLGAHQLDNVAAAIQTALCLRREGWKISDSAIRLGVENTIIAGRFQFATPAEATKLGAHRSTVILDGAHTKGSAAALAQTLRETFPNECVAMVVAMAADKDHRGFARAVFEGTNSRIIVVTRVDIAGSYKRSMSPTSLADSFRRAGQDLEMKVLTGLRSDPRSGSINEGLSSSACTTVSNSGFSDSTVSTGTNLQGRGQLCLVVEEEDSIQLAIAKAAQMIHEMNGKKPGVICITGSLHAVSAAMSLLQNTTKQSF